jgi:hypothetical protein
MAMRVGILERIAVSGTRPSCGATGARDAASDGGSWAGAQHRGAGGRCRWSRAAPRSSDVTRIT